MVTHVSTQRLDQLLARRLELAACQRDELLWVRLAARQGVEDRAATLAEHVGDHAGDLDVRVFECLLDPLRVARHLANELLPRAHERAEILDHRRRHEARADQPVREQVGEPLRVLHIGLATGHALHVRRVREHQLA